MNWPDTYIKYDKTELMKSFTNWMFVNYYYDSNYYDHNIKDMWGYLKAFAESKGIIIMVNASYDTKCFCDWMRGTGEWVTIDTKPDAEAGMNWCANKLFQL